MKRLFQQVLSKLNPDRMYFQYSGFYDFPLGIIASHGGRKYLLEREFDDGLDEYEDFFRVYDITGISLRQGERIWDHLDAFTENFLCAVRINEMTFDEDRRRWIG